MAEQDVACFSFASNSSRGYMAKQVEAIMYNLPCTTTTKEVVAPTTRRAMDMGCLHKHCLHQHTFNLLLLHWPQQQPLEAAGRAWVGEHQ